MPEALPVLNAKAAIARHIQWRITLQLAITLQEPLSPLHAEQIRHYRKCAIGEWLDSASTESMRGQAVYHDLVDKHRAFHREMQYVANLIEDRRYPEAERSIDPFSSFWKSSQALAHAVMAYDRVAPIALRF